MKKRLPNKKSMSLKLKNVPEPTAKSNASHIKRKKQKNIFLQHLKILKCVEEEKNENRSKY